MSGLADQLKAGGLPKGGVPAGIRPPLANPTGSQLRGEPTRVSLRAIRQRQKHWNRERMNIVPKDLGLTSTPLVSSDPHCNFGPRKRLRGIVTALHNNNRAGRI